MKNETIAAFIGGMLLGGVIALLLAPESGAQTRKHIKDFIDKEVDEIKNGYAVESGKNRQQPGACTEKGNECGDADVKESVVK